MDCGSFLELIVVVPVTFSRQLRDFSGKALLVASLPAPSFRSACPPSLALVHDEVVKIVRNLDKLGIDRRGSFRHDLVLRPGPGSTSRQVGVRPG